MCIRCDNEFNLLIVFVLCIIDGGFLLSELSDVFVVLPGFSLARLIQGEGGVSVLGRSYSYIYIKIGW